ncbi:hypothetical protein [Glutamicibacter arilaitensis]|uniref:Uncharacterized protein n=1 Tax=Glutamicibacter arilaitensis TaxID=256701 RepID=A0A4Y8U0S4_9MICC|nr:hypothetical protein [Glutamicibacter arilaitensis]TFH57304.1 hypothetical protein EXY26_10000 [Glutamicibacter arilaitensis]
MAEKLIQAAEEALNLLIEAGADTPSKAGTAHNRIRRAISQLKVATSSEDGETVASPTTAAPKGFIGGDLTMSEELPSGQQERCSKVNGTYCQRHQVEHGREESPAVVTYKDGTSTTFQVRKIDVERDWIWLENSAGKTVAIIAAREVHSITRK